MYVKCVPWSEIYLEFPVRAANMAVNINNQDTNWYLLCYNAFLENFDCFICCMYLKDVHRKLSKSISFSFKRHFMLYLTLKYEICQSQVTPDSLGWVCSGVLHRTGLGDTLNHWQAPLPPFSFLCQVSRAHRVHHSFQLLTLFLSRHMTVILSSYCVWDFADMFRDCVITDQEIGDGFGFTSRGRGRLPVSIP